MGKIGLFFVINNSIYHLSIPLSLGISDGKFINHPKSHFEFFHELTHSNRYLDYGRYKRGRVIYDISKDRYLVYVDKRLKDNIKMIDKIKSIYNLSEKETILIKTDEHYRTSNI